MLTWSDTCGKHVEGYVPTVSALIRARHIPFGVIFIAADGTGPDARWMRSAQDGTRAVAALSMPPPDHVIFQTWHAFPTHNLPETAPEAFTHLIDDYFDHDGTPKGGGDDRPPR